MPWTFYNSAGQKLSTAATSINVLDIDGATDIGAAIVDADLFIIDDGAGGTNRKTAASRIKTYIGAGSAVAWVGSQETEGTSTSTSAANLLVSSTISIVAATPCQFTFVAGKSTGHASAAACGFTVNATVLRAASTSGNKGSWRTGATNLLEFGQGNGILPTRIGGNYGRVATGLSHSYGGGTSQDSAGATSINQDADAPTATLTSITIPGIVANASNTIRADALEIYSYPVA